MLKILKRLSKKEWLIFLICSVLIFGQVFLELKIPDYMSEITVLVQTPGSELKDVLINGGYMLLSTFGTLVSAIIVGYFMAKISSGFSARIREKLFTKVSNLSVADTKNFSTSSLITRTTNDVTQVEMFIAMGIQLLIKAPITAVWAILKILNKSFEWTIVTSVAVVFMTTVVGIIIAIVTPRFKLVQSMIDKLNGITRESLTGIRVIRAFNAEKYQEKKFQNSSEELTKLQKFNQKAFSILYPLMFSTMHFVTLAIFLVGAHLISQSVLSNKLVLFGDMIVFSSYAMQVIMSFIMLAMIFMILPRAQVSAKRINEVLDTEDKIIEGKLTKGKEKGTVEFRNVSFKYPDSEEYLLKDISFKVNKGETIAFIGSTGSGKSTLINLIPRFYDVSSGEVLVNGVNVKEYKLDKLNNLISYVSQEAVIFSGTIKSNVKFGSSGRKITDQQLKESLKIAQARKFVESLDKKYDSVTAQSGSNLSGGQKQRLSIARAIAKNPEIIIFDDSFSALDYKTDLMLRQELNKSLSSVTSLIVAQRIGTIMHADKIVVLEKGLCVGMGTHQELMKSCDVYKEIALSQLSKEELKNA
ncbi:MAG: ABC transporter ATP-binding protein [Mollicutes bacterium]|jgi:ATP-binding cassette subfamily B protein|nr:ABC transporter ATP-binding protein [Mollicutes bacterium]